ncbi:MAG: C10 family peptidase [Solidesulfovibrio sp.]|uniref:C10 family peptidase n=1 Tax=Solidesulfovibrio sp. TaxID=2910990 RepID=UPI002B2052E5|nr:C10 family peptidase [Solidesulfovibrio sp.]MEA4855968.1 C10 family peptidase [Solidesulfovibrio sp.]
MIQPWRMRALLIAGILYCLFIFVPISVFSATVSLDKANLAANGFAMSGASFMGKDVSGDIKSVVPVVNDAGLVLYYVVHTSPVGLIILAGDDQVEPIIAYSASATDIDTTTQHAIGALLQNDLSGRLAGIQAGFAAGDGKAAGAASATAAWARLEWLGASRQAPGWSVQPAISDVRVAPLIQSTWSQENLFDYAPYDPVSNPHLYNLLTPNNYPSGCVATAMTQVMRYFQYPTAPVGSQSGLYYYLNGDTNTPIPADFLGGDGQGGAYGWSDATMPLSPEASITESQRLAIGRLLFDAGISVHMDYASDGSGTNGELIAQSLVQHFFYGNAHVCQTDLATTDSSLSTAIHTAIDANLDSGLPVVLGIHRLGGGHEIVCDGYGIYTVEDEHGHVHSAPYHHMNMGWAGEDDWWYNLPTIDTPYSYNYTVLNHIIYNIFKTSQNEDSNQILSGRVLQQDQLPVPGAVVKAVTGNSSFQTTSNEKGIYAFTQIPANAAYTVTAEKAGYAFASKSVNIGKSSDFSLTTGNKWGINFVSSTEPGAGVAPRMLLLQ